MSLPLLAALALPLCLAPWQTHRWFFEVHARERAAIAVDNGAIRLGGETRSVLEFVRHSLARLSSLEAAHDVAHVCARTPSPAAAECLGQDLVLERALEAGHSSLEAVASGRWAAARLVALQEGARLDEVLTLGEDASRPCWERSLCPVCGHRFRHRWTSPPSPVLGSKDGARVRVQWTGDGGQGPWNYRLIWEKADGFETTGGGAL